MAPPTSLTSVEGLRAYLSTRSISSSSITLLTGGTANYVYRVERDGGSVVYKHAAPYLHSNTNFAFDPVRMDYEAHALEILPPLLSQLEFNVHAVKLYSYDKEAKLLEIEDGGKNHLKDAYTDPRLDIPEIGKQLGRWIAALHLQSTKISLSLPNSADTSGNNPIAVAIYRYSYMNLHTALAEYNHDPKFGEYINEEFGSRLATDDECVCHGDFWPGNVLVRFHNETSKDVDLTVVDWEMTRRGTSATDIGQFATEAFFLDRFRGGRGLLPSFLNTYLDAREESKVGKEWVRRMAVHWGVHVAFWPTRVNWTDRDGIQKLVDIGVGVLKAAVYEDWETLRASELFRHVGNVWDSAWDR